MPAPADFDHCFPFHIGIDAGLRISAVGPALARLDPGLQPGCSFFSRFLLTWPGVDPEWNALLQARAAPFHLIHRESGRRFWGQGFVGPNAATFYLLCTPWLDEPADPAAAAPPPAGPELPSSVTELLEMVHAQRAAIDGARRLSLRLDEQRRQLEQLTHQLAAEKAEARRLALVAESTDNAVIITDGKGLIQWVNPAFERLTGYPLAEAYGRSPGALLQCPGTDPLTIAFMRERLAARASFTTEILNRSRDGRRYWLRLDVQPIFDQAGTLTHFMAIQSDITASQHRQRCLSVESAIANVLAEADDIEPALRSIVQALLENLGWGTGALFRPAPGDPQPRCDYALPAESDLATGTALAAQAIALGTPSWTATSDDAAETGFAIPVREGTEVIAAVAFFSRRFGPIDEELRRVLELASAHLTQFVVRKRTEKQLLRLMSEMSAIFELSPDGFISFDSAGRRTYANPALRRMAAADGNDLQAATLDEFEARLTCLLDPAKPPETAEDGTTVLHLIQPRRKVLKRAVREATDRLGRTIGRVDYFRDITRETELDRLKGEFLSAAAHELRTPMASIHGFTELLLRRNFDEERRRDILETIFRQSSRLVTMVNELLDLARLEARAGKDFQLLDQPLAPVIEGAVQGLMVSNDPRQVTLKLPANLPRARIDRDKLIQALINVLSNAYKYSPGGGAITVSLRRRQDHPASIGIVVKDRGIGMTADQAKRVFERFYRANPAGNIPGTGLGMSLVDEIMKLMGGEVEVTSRFGKGTEVVLWIQPSS